MGLSARLSSLLLTVGTALALSLAAQSTQAAERLPEQAITIPVRGEVTESFYLTVPATPPKAILILFPGGSGAIEVREPIPPAEKAGNFLTRSRTLLTAQGFVVATLDAPSDAEEGMVEDFRISATHGEDVRQVAAWLKARYPLPVWLVGTSRGTLSAANAALRLGAEIDGLVLTSSVTRASKQGPHSLLATDMEKSIPRMPGIATKNGRRHRLFHGADSDLGRLLHLERIVRPLMTATNSAERYASSMCRI